MSYEKVLQAQQVLVGTKQTMRALKEGSAQEVVVAEDADPAITTKIMEAANKAGVPVTKVDSMKKLGEACKIQVRAAAVAIIR
ncbi:50S ribosomal protein L7ae-like protein [Anoxybacillus rupiensis]|jgi:large subunit ribosomal protein L7A|uniref:RNA-binding protein P9850_16140 n=1 Tax=Anoxybacteroides rupiense TaxID=311460 RepID=A0ABD5J156_9BACL|nr:MULTISPECIES: 50S ribosomal protein L7ae-like protein [Anoxybacillus]MBS2772459.1 50S ribosomal protein L7ae-like protein [Anoxybacillus rupiensis]MDE8565141.1 50S ribosomal protein L7ae-like protein [Anoxybacillus rupiensis]MED5053326.1 50S ribosomal protein L7ae-like protein [Anoxybacillus rupiensis]QHC02675.1 50S ribosomal protein L7ae-like protein [Anoxybacillus sp. PDR2]